MTTVAAVRSLPFSQKGLTHSEAKRIARLLRILRDMEIELRWEDLGRRIRGHYVFGGGSTPFTGCDLIVLNPLLQGFQVVFTLAHEIAHAMFGDLESTEETEERANRIGAVLAVDPAEFRKARRNEDKSRSIQRQYGVSPSGFAHLIGGSYAANRCSSRHCHPGRPQLVADADQKWKLYP